jgi:hypothetical protein
MTTSGLAVATLRMKRFQKRTVDGVTADFQQNLAQSCHVAPLADEQARVRSSVIQGQSP